MPPFCRRSVNVRDSPRLIFTWIHVALGSIELLARLSERWRHIYFNLPSSLYEAFHPVQGHVPLLRYASMHFRPYTWPHGPFEMFSITPQLRQVQFHGFPNIRMVLPFAQLRSISANTSDIDYWKCWMQIRS